MSSLLTVVAYVAALNPARTRLGLPGTDKAIHWRIVISGVAIGCGTLFGVSAVAGGTLDRLDISPETFRIAAGFVLVISAAWMLFAPVPHEEPVAPGWAGALWPVAYPRVLSPETLTLALTVGASDGAELLAPVVAGAVLIVLGRVGRGALSRRVLVGLGRLTSAVLVVVGVWLALQGVREV